MKQNVKIIYKLIKNCRRFNMFKIQLQKIEKQFNFFNNNN